MYTERAEKLAELEKVLDRDVYLFCHNRRNDNACIDGTMIDVLRRVISFAKISDGAAIIIQTPGGSLDESYYIGTFFREYYSKVDSYIVSDCYSGGTIIALSTDNIYMSRSACLGPIDIQRYGHEDKKESWYPALSGQIEALRAAMDDGKIDSFLEKTFSKEMYILADYFREQYTYKDLVGKSLEKHCLEGADKEEIWKYMSALNISHGTPLTYSKLLEKGLRVELMPKNVEFLIGKLIRDIEHEYGDLKSKSVLCDIYDEMEMSAKVAKRAPKRISKDADSDPDEYEDEYYKHEYLNKRSVEKLAVIETSKMGFVQTLETMVTFVDSVPAYLSELSNGWEEELDESLVSSEQKEKVNKLVSYYVKIAARNEGIVSLTSEDYQLRLQKASTMLSQMAVDKLIKSKIDIDDMPSSVRYQMIVECLLKKMTIIKFNKKVEGLLINFMKKSGKDYEKLDNVDKIESYYSFLRHKALEIKRKSKMSDEKFKSLSEIDRLRMIEQYLGI